MTTTPHIAPHRTTSHSIHKFKTAVQAVALLIMALAAHNAAAQCPTIEYLPRSERAYLTSRGWDTVVTCSTPEIDLDVTYWVTARTFNGNYTVESIPYNPPDPSFCSTAGGGQRIFADEDDCWAAPINLPFNFVFFGNVYSRAQVGANGIVSFNTNYPVREGGTCNYTDNNSRSIPNPNFEHRNAIYGIFEDIDPRYTTTLERNAGIYESIYDTFPCRKLCVSWNGILGYGQTSNTKYGTYQIVCYEGTNIIEVHVKHRTSDPTSNEYGTIGIINAAGNSAFAPTSRNPFRTDITTPEAWRFTPMGEQECNITWYLGTDTTAATGVIISNNDSISTILNTRGEASRLRVRPTVPQTYTARLRYVNATGIRYDISTHITVGVIQTASINLSAPENLCHGMSDTIRVNYDGFDIQAPTSIEWQTNDPRQVLQPIGNARQALILPYQWDSLAGNETRTVELQCTVNFSNSCSLSTTTTINLTHRADSALDLSVCGDNAITYRGNEYRTGEHTINITQGTPCPYNVTLNITNKPEESTVERVSSCLPYTWQDGITYYESTTTPTVRLTNREGCDSVVHLFFAYDTSLRAIISVNPPNASLGQSIITLKDMTESPHTRLWTLHDGTQSTEQALNYIFPTEYDSVDISLRVTNGECNDETSRTIHLYKEALYFPNAFTPDETANKTFEPHGTGILSITVDIYDRRGLRVAHLEGMDSHWDGTTGGRRCDTGAYTYMATYTSLLQPREPRTMKGTVLLIR